MPGQPLPPALISSMAGILLSLVFSHIPALAGWFNRLGEYPNLSQYGRKQDRRARKPQVMLALRLRVPPAAFILAYSLWLAAVNAVGSPPAVPAASNPQSEIRNSSIRNPKFELRNSSTPNCSSLVSEERALPLFISKSEILQPLLLPYPPPIRANWRKNHTD